MIQQAIINTLEANEKIQCLKEIKSQPIYFLYKEELNGKFTTEKYSNQDKI